MTTATIVAKDNL